MPTTKLDLPPTNVVVATVDANNAFALDLFQQLRVVGGNLFFSPYSVSAALAMAAEGARGETASELAAAFHWPEDWRRPDPGPEGRTWHSSWFLAGLSQLQAEIGPKSSAATDALRQELPALRQALEDANAKATRLRGRGRGTNSGVVRVSGEEDWKAYQAAAQEAQEAATQLNALLVKLDPYELRVANSLWAERTYPISPDYLRAISAFSGPDRIFQADFKTQFPAERIRINSWVTRQTEDRIKDIIPELPPDQAQLLRLVLVNAIYFRGEWSKPFESTNTKPRDFSLGDGRRVQVATMHEDYSNAGSYAAFKADGSFFRVPHEIPRGKESSVRFEPGGFSMLELPYKGDRLAMVLVAPNSPAGLDALLNLVSSTNLSTWLGHLERRTVHIIVPKFRVESSYQLVQHLKKLGMGRSFTNPNQPQGADFSGISTSLDPDLRPYISEVIHKAFVEVTEKGTEAAAATVVMVAPASAVRIEMVPYYPTFAADRPFLFLIRDRATGCLLFMGRVTKPQA